MKVTEAIGKLFAVKSEKGKVNNADMLARYQSSMEVQVNVAADKGNQVAGKHNTWEDEHESWWHIRIPKKAMTDSPEWHDYDLDWSLDEHAEGIGLTGWDWANKRSKWVGFDFDAITGHADGVGVSESEIQKVKDMACNIPWVEVRLSTRGAGIHLYVYFYKDPADPGDQGIRTNNHNEHAALARCVLGMMSKDTGFDFSQAIDCCGGNMWVWHRGATKENRGLTQVKPATEPLRESDLPANWRDNLDVVTRQRSRVRVRGIEEKDEDQFTLLANSRSPITLTDAHNDVIDALGDTGYTSLWHHDYRLVQTHTRAFKALMDNNPGKYDGCFDTLSDGTDPGKPNCLSGDTMVITRKGARPIRELAGTTQTVLTQGRHWTQAPFKTYGKQEVLAITLQQGQSTKVIKATPDHGWFVADRIQVKTNGRPRFNTSTRVETKDLQIGDRLVQVFSSDIGQISPGVVGIQHGLVFGDGDAKSQVGHASPRVGRLCLFGDKDKDLSPYFNQHPQRDIEGGVEISNLPGHFKSLVDLDYDKPYLYGWLAGYFAADGCVNTLGSCIIRSADKASIQHVRDVCALLGIGTSPITVQERGVGTYKPGVMFTTILKRCHLKENFFLLTKHRKRFLAAPKPKYYAWTVKSIESACKEEVFCCTVPDTHSFVLEDNILTGNCFAFPLPGHGFRVFRFGRGGTEADTWVRGDNGWLSCYFDRLPTFEAASRASGGAELGEGGFHFDSLEEALAAVDMLGADVTIDREKYGKREAVFKPTNQDGKLIIKMKAIEGDEKLSNGWVLKRGWWEKVVRPIVEDAASMEDFAQWDSVVRCTKSIENENAGWFILDNRKEWVSQPKTDVKSYLAQPSFNIRPKDAEAILGASVNSSWRLVNQPFQPEYPGDRQWNYRAAQWKYPPAIIEDGEPTHTHWDMVLDHIGNDLDIPIRDSDWAVRHNITSGRHYLQLWIACLLRCPFDKLPFLFLYGDENCGKSTLWHAIDRLVTDGVMDAKFAFRDSEFNGELENCVLAVIEEINPHGKDGKLARARMKDWSVSDWLGIRRMRRDAYRVRNTLHFIQISNHIEDCMMALGDTRGMIMYVRSLVDAGFPEIPHAALMQALDDEAPHFMRTLCDMELPPPESRLRIECIITESKRKYMESQSDDLSQFIYDNCKYAPGEVVLWSDLYEQFLESLPNDTERHKWSRKRVSAGIPDRYPTGAYGAKNKTHIGNMVMNHEGEVPSEIMRHRPLISYHKRLRRSEPNDR